MTAMRKIRIGLMDDGIGGTTWGWRQPGIDTNASTDVERYKRTARRAEAAKLDFIFIADSLHVTEKSSPHFLNRLEPMTLLSALAGVTSNIGLAATISTSFEEPFTVARQLASLDLISGGRAGWNVVTSGLEGAALNHSRTALGDHDERYVKAEEHVAVCQGLWDSWEDDAFVHDKAGGVFFDPDKLHWLNHEGKYFQVKGPLNIQRSPQGQPVIFQAGASNAGRALAARTADTVFGLPRSIEEARAYYSDLKQRARAFGRDPSTLLVLAGINPIVGSTEAEAEAKYRMMTEFITVDEALRQLSQPFSYHDFSQYDLDAPFPDIPDLGSNSYLSTTDQVKKLAAEKKLTLRETALQFATPRTEFIGSAERVADAMQHWFETGAVDGFILSCRLAHGVEEFCDQVLPILRQRGLFRTDYEAATLRGNLGLPIPSNRYAAAREGQGDKRLAGAG